MLRNRFLYVSNFAGGTLRQYDVTDPHDPRLVDEVEPGPHDMLLK